LRKPQNTGNRLKTLNDYKSGAKEWLSTSGCFFDVDVWQGRGGHI